MKKYSIILIFLVSSLSVRSQSNCNWQTLNQDGFEYSSPIPDLLPGVAIHPNPMASGFAPGYVAYAGTYAMYLNFIDCNSGSGTCAGAKVYERTYSVCPGMPVRIRAWMTTMFNGAGYIQSNVKMVIRDSNGIMLDSVPALSIPFRTNGGWIEYISGTVNPTTSTIVFQMFTNVDRGQGNDLTVDELRLQGCVRTGSAQAATICSDVAAYDLYNFLPSSSVTNGTWSGPSVLAGGYLGSFTTGVNTSGTYLYNSTPYGNGTGCPTRTDSVIAINSNPPSVSLPVDTVLCLNQSITLNAGGTANTYLWNTGATSGVITASNPGSTPTSSTYTVTVTNQSGCSTIDSIAIDFINCSTIEEGPVGPNFNIYPNPAHRKINLVFESSLPARNLHLLFTDASGRIVFEYKNEMSTTFLDLPELPAGLYLVQVIADSIPQGMRMLHIR